MKTYIVTTNDAEKLQIALARMIEYAEFLAGEYGYNERVDYIFDILSEEEVTVETKEL